VLLNAAEKQQPVHVTSAAKCCRETKARLMQIQTLYMAYADRHKAEYIIVHHKVPTIHLAESLKLFNNSSVYTKVMPFAGNSLLNPHECRKHMNVPRTVTGCVLWDHLWMAETQAVGRVA
jgi:hypothetical protein